MKRTREVPSLLIKALSACIDDVMLVGDRTAASVDMIVQFDGW